VLCCAVCCCAVLYAAVLFSTRSLPHAPPHSQTALRSDRPSGPQGLPRLCQPGRPLGLPGGSPEAGGGGWRPFKKKTSPSPRRWTLKQSLQGLECLRGTPGTGFSMIWRLLRTMGVALLYLSVAGRAWRCSSAIFTELLSFNPFATESGMPD
jgi:hypothetical protein